MELRGPAFRAVRSRILGCSDLVQDFGSGIAGVKDFGHLELQDEGCRLWGLPNLGLGLWVLTWQGHPPRTGARTRISLNTLNIVHKADLKP